MSFNYQPQIKAWSKFQGSLLTKSLMIAGLMFILIAAIGYGFGVFFSQNIIAAQYLYIISIVLLIITMFSSPFLFARIQQTKKITILLIMGIYVLAQGLSFGILFCAFGIEHPENLMLIFAFAGFIALICGVIGKLMSYRTMLTLGKVLLAASAGVMITMLISIFLLIFSPDGFSTLFSILYIVMAVLFMGYIAYDVKMISSMSSFVEAQEQNVRSNLVLLFAYKLLMDLIGLVWILASILLRYSR